MILPGEVERTLLVKTEDQSHGYGKDPNTRTMQELLEKGVINLDKPFGPTSHEVTAWVKNILHLKKAGHSGTLDPHVTGVLPMMLGEATRLVQVLLLSGKEYVCVMRLHKDVPEIKVRALLQEFTGTIYQRPPLVSAVKRQLRKRTIYYIDISKWTAATCFSRWAARRARISVSCATIWAKRSGPARICTSCAARSRAHSPSWKRSSRCRT